MNFLALNGFKSYISQFDNSPDDVKLKALKEGMVKYNLTSMVPRQWVSFINNLEVSGGESTPSTGSQSPSRQTDVGVGYRPGLTADCQPVPRLKLGG